MSEQVVVSFPGLGIGETVLNPVAFTLFGKFEVRWYGLFITLGMVLAFFYVIWRGRKNEGIKSDDVIDVGMVVIVLSIVGARLYYVLTTLGEYHSFYDVIAVWNGGLGIYGGVLGGALGIFIVCKIKKINLLRFYDAVVPAVIFAQVLGRWGNFFNGEAYGYQIVDGSSRYFFFLKEFSVPVPSFLRMGLLPNEFSTSLAYVHPTFLYESVWNLCGFILLNLLYRKKKFNGQILLSYLAWYGFGRMFIEGLRTDSLYIFKGIFGTDGVRISQLVGLLCFLIGAALLIFIPVYRKKHPRFAAYEKPSPETGAPAEAPEKSETPEEPMREENAEPVVEEPLDSNEKLPFEDTVAEQMFARREDEEPGPEPEAPAAPEPEEPAAEMANSTEKTNPAQGESPVEENNAVPTEPRELEPAQPAAKPRRKPTNQRGTVTLPGKKKKPAKKTPVAKRGSDHADH